METIVQKDELVLREIAEEVPVGNITSPKIQKVIKDMREALIPHKDGVAIAAPQIGVPLRIFVVAGYIFDGEAFAEDDKSKAKTKDMVFINPVLTKLSKKKTAMMEGCLSVRFVYGEVRRSTKATVTAWDESGKKITRGASGLLAQIFQHEVDHLSGILFTDKAKHVEEVPPSLNDPK